MVARASIAEEHVEDDDRSRRAEVGPEQVQRYQSDVRKKRARLPDTNSRAHGESKASAGNSALYYTLHCITDNSVL